MNYAELIAKWRAEIGAHGARMQALLELSAKEGRTLDETESGEFADLEVKVKKGNEHLARLISAQAASQPTLLASDTLPQGAVSVQASVQQHRQQSPSILLNRTKDDAFKGQSFTRILIAQLQQKQTGIPAYLYAQKRWGKENPLLAAVLAFRDGIQLRAADIPGGGTTAPNFGNELVDADNRFAGDFKEFLYSKTIYDQLPLRRVPSRVNIKGMDGAFTGYWTGEGKAIKVSAPSFESTVLNPLKATGLTVMSRELMRDSNPSIEQMVRDNLVTALSQVVDRTFISSNAASAGVSPAGIFNGVSVLHSAGDEYRAALDDMTRLIQIFIDNNANVGDLQWLMNRSLALKLSMLVGENGQTIFPTITVEGGTLKALPVKTGDNIPANTLALVQPSEIWRIDDTNISVDVSTEATIEMSDAPTGAELVPTDATENPVSMFQSDSIAVKVVRDLSFQKRRSFAAQHINDADYSNTVSA